MDKNYESENTMNILETIKNYAQNSPQRPAVQSNEDTLTYMQLEHFSDVLAGYLVTQYGTDSTPIVVYGHKHPYMLVCFLACVKAGRAYCPIDISVPHTRVQAIMDAVNPQVILAVSDLEVPCDNTLSLSAMENIVALQEDICLSETHHVTGDDTFYIIFTSGSTGAPKGVEITADCLNNYLDWAVDLGISRLEKEGCAFLNQAPFSFDLSVMDLYTCLACGGTLWTLDKESQKDYNKMFDIMNRGHIKVWVSTPSFADICLVDKKFAQSLLPELKTFLFCGETLTNNTAGALLSRFEKASVINTYGPTESTVALTDIHITKEVNDTINPLPVGKVKPGSYIEIWDENGHPLPEGTHGEIIIIGNTVSTGYYKQTNLSEKAFFTCTRNGITYRGYHTGDEGYLKNAQLYYCGRIDLQIKLHGYRIEIEDIEHNILKVEHIKNVAVTPNMQDGKVKSLTAHVVYALPIESKFQTGQLIKKTLKSYLPDYMIPKKMNFLERLPMTINGKCDRKRLGGQTS